jgi:hypothetical protein
VQQSHKPRKPRPAQSGDLFVEWVPSNLYRSGNMVPVSALPQILAYTNPGFATVYKFAYDDAMRIRINGSIRGFSSSVVTASAVTLDIDDPKDINEVTTKLDSLGLGYHVWDSGRGFHVVIPHEVISDALLPYSHRCWVEQLDLPVDYSLYQHARILRLPGQVNPKTGRPKQLVRSVWGMEPVIKIVEKPVFNFKPNGGLTTLASALNRLQRLASTEPLPGNRHTQLWGTAKEAFEANLSYSSTLEILQEVNATWQNPKPAEEVELAVQQAYKIPRSGQE